VSGRVHRLLVGFPAGIDLRAIMSKAMYWFDVLDGRAENLAAVLAATAAAAEAEAETLVAVAGPAAMVATGSTALRWQPQREAAAELRAACARATAMALVAPPYGPANTDEGAAVNADRLDVAVAACLPLLGKGKLGRAALELVLVVEGCGVTGESIKHRRSL
jgi:hypothetical protein